MKLINKILFYKTKNGKKSIKSQISSLRQVDWVPLLTRDVVDDFASHLRLFRKAKERTAFQAKEKDKTLSPEDLEAELLSNFFDFELEMEKSLCRDLLSTTPHYENGKN